MTTPATDTAPAPVYLPLRELLEDPTLLAEPECVLPRVAWRGRASAICAGDKSGKTTLVADGCARATRGHVWLAEMTDVPRRVVWMGLEEAVGDAVRRFRELGADPDRIHVLVMAPPDLLARTREALREWPADLLVVDSLTEYARVACGRVPDDGDSAGWAAVVRPLVALARELDIAVLIIHHVRRSDGQYRGSSEIAAAVDCLLEMTMPGEGEDQAVRRIRGRARWPVEPCRVRYVAGRYELVPVGAEIPVSLDARVLAYVVAHPGSGERPIREALSVRYEAVRDAIARLIDAGAIERRGRGPRSGLYAAGPQLDIAS